MKVLYSPCVTIDNDEIHYNFENEKITVTWGILTDEFDFTGCPDGFLSSVETILPENPIIEAKRENGELYVKLLKFISSDASEEEKFPDYVEVGEESGGN